MFHSIYAIDVLTDIAKVKKELTRTKLIFLLHLHVRFTTINKTLILVLKV